MSTNRRSRARNVRFCVDILSIVFMLILSDREHWPPGEMTERLAAYANAHGRTVGWPYYSLDGERPVTAKQWDELRYRWRHAHGLTNVLSRPPLHGQERLKGTGRRAAPRVHRPTAASCAHLNQKPA